SSLRNPEHVYPHTGVYTATLSVSGPRGKGSSSEAVDVELGYTDIVRQTPTSPPTVGTPSVVLATVTLTPPAPSIVIMALPSPTSPPALTNTPALSRTPRHVATAPPLQVATVAPSATKFQSSHSPTPQPPRPAPPTTTDTPQPQPSNTPLPPTSTPLPPTNTPAPKPSETPHPQPSETEGPKPTCTPHTGDAPLDRGCDGGH
ncbi:MAG: hypothetical protein DLM69_05880, partial [Candidatus Chloroheliales bacterium]